LHYCIVEIFKLVLKYDQTDILDAIFKKTDLLSKIIKYGTSSYNIQENIKSSQRIKKEFNKGYIGHLLNLANVIQDMSENEE